MVSLTATEISGLARYASGRDKAPPVGEAFRLIVFRETGLGDACRFEGGIDVLRLVADDHLIADGRHGGRVSSQRDQAHDAFSVAGNVHFLKRDVFA